MTTRSNFALLKNFHFGNDYPESRTCQVYAIRLKASVLNDPKFMAANPGYIPGSPCYYIGMTSLDPGERYAQHASGIVNASKIAHAYLGELDMTVVPKRKVTRRTWAQKHERQLAKELRARGFGVWQA